MNRKAERQTGHRSGPTSFGPPSRTMPGPERLGVLGLGRAPDGSLGAGMGTTFRAARPDSGSASGSPRSAQLRQRSWDFRGAVSRSPPKSLERWMSSSFGQGLSLAISVGSQMMTTNPSPPLPSDEEPTYRAIRRRSMPCEQSGCFPLPRSLQKLRHLRALTAPTDQHHDRDTGSNKHEDTQDDQSFGAVLGPSRYGRWNRSSEQNGNLVGALSVVGMVYLAEWWKQGEGSVGVTALSIAAGKASLPFSAVFVRAILANALVCLAVWLATARPATSAATSTAFSDPSTATKILSNTATTSCVHVRGSQTAWEGRRSRLVPVDRQDGRRDGGLRSHRWEWRNLPADEEAAMALTIEDPATGTRLKLKS